ncbi:alpha/beta-Hydrolases superfamily protein [Zea mays]|uniref:Alpha/beta-Hydrolases superfamily protein n=1 Tax=Zea mays TaxID=4577 RepID=A0A1D6K4T5_MAIZE|nr:alpha/beta-Hydrolases superfamily protein [Zea mays]
MATTPAEDPEPGLPPPKALARPLPPGSVPLGGPAPLLRPPPLAGRHQHRRPPLGAAAARAAARAPPPRVRRVGDVAVGPVPPQPPRGRPRPHRPGPPLLRRLLVHGPRPLRHLPGQDREGRHGRHGRAPLRRGRRQLRRLRRVPAGGHVPGGRGAGGPRVVGRVPGGGGPRRGPVPRRRRRGGGRAARPPPAGGGAPARQAHLRPAAAHHALLLPQGLHQCDGLRPP